MNIVKPLNHLTGAGDRHAGRPGTANRTTI